MTGLVYLRVTDRELPYLAKLRVMALEAALNEALLSQAMPGADPAAGERDLIRDERLLRRSIAEQARTWGRPPSPTTAVASGVSPRAGLRHRGVPAAFA